MRAIKTIHFCFFSLFIVAEDIAIACFILAFFLKFSEIGVHVLYAIGAILFFCWLILIFFAKVKWKIRVFGKHPLFEIERKTINTMLLTGIGSFFVFVMANQVNAQFGPVALIQASAFWLFSSDAIHIRPLMKQ